METLYLIAGLIALVGCVVWFFNQKAVILQEFLGAAGLALVTAAFAHCITFYSATTDYETWSGQVTRGVHYPRWVEEYTVTVTDYDSDGKPSGSHTETRYTTHPEHWTAETNINETYSIDQRTYRAICKLFNNHSTEYVYKSGFYSGDHNIYPSYNKTGYVIPVTGWKRFENRLKSSPNLFQFAKVPKGAAIFPYPANKNWSASDRLVGKASTQISTLLFDQMNARLGPRKRVNVIMVGFNSEDAQLAQWQQAAWFNGRKNDLVLCYDASNSKPTWAFVFGWTEQEIVKRNLESILLDNVVNDELLPLIEDVIAKDYLLKDWSKFSYIGVQASPTAIVWYTIILIVTQAAYWIWALNNDISKISNRYRYA